MSGDKANLLDMLEGARAIQTFLAEAVFDDLVADRKLRSADLYELTVIGEAVKRLSTGFRTRNPEIDWKSIAGLRDVITHGYDVVDLGEIWWIVPTDLPGLIEFLESKLK